MYIYITSQSELVAIKSSLPFSNCLIAFIEIYINHCSASSDCQLLTDIYIYALETLKFISTHSICCCCAAFQISVRGRAHTIQCLDLQMENPFQVYSCGQSARARYVVNQLVYAKRLRLWASQHRFTHTRTASIHACQP